MVFFIALVSIGFAFTGGAILRHRSVAARRFIPCAFCGSVVLTWAWMLVGRWFGVAWLGTMDALLLLGILMGGSAVGFPTRVARAWRTRGVEGAGALRAGMITMGFALVFTVLTGRWGWFTALALIVAVAAMVIASLVRGSGAGDGARRSFLAKLNHCCDES